MIPSDIFDRVARARAQRRSFASALADRWLLNRMAIELIERLAPVRRDLATALVTGPGADLLVAPLSDHGLDVSVATLVALPGLPVASHVVEEDAIIGIGRTFDLIIACGGLDSVNDLPGALIQLRRLLSLDGLFLGAFVGAGSVAGLKSLCQAITPGIARVHPQIDIRASGDLLARAGFTLPVADSETVSVRYTSFDRLLADLRANAMTNTLTSRRALSRSALEAMTQAFARTERVEQFVINYLTGWARPEPHRLTG